MVSQFSRQRSASSVQRDDVVRLLRDGTVVSRPTATILYAASALEELGLLSCSNEQYVRCADPIDRDFPPRNRTCPGKIYLHDGLDEAGYDYRCPECERPVFPDRFAKRRYPELRITLHWQGVLEYIAGQLGRVGKAGLPCRGVFRVALGDHIAHVCIVEVCNDAKYLARDWAVNQPTIYVSVDGSAANSRFLEEDWLSAVLLADIVCGDVDLGDELKSTIRRGPPATLRNVSVPVYRIGPAPIVVASGLPLSVRTSSVPDTGPAFSPEHGAAADEYRGPDRVVSPSMIIWRGQTHDCDLTEREVVFLEIALPNSETEVTALMYRGKGALWNEPYVATQQKRNKISQFLNRLNNKLLNAKPVVPVNFSLRRSLPFVSRNVAEPQQTSGGSSMTVR